MVAIARVSYSSSGTTAGTDYYDRYDNDTSASTDSVQYVWHTTDSASTADYEPSLDYEVSYGRNDRESDKKYTPPENFDKFLNRIRAIDNERNWRSRTYRNIPRRKAKLRGRSAAKRRR